ncbi:AlpA family phage regulatory protein [Parashewanella spongiae]|nr:AlpA family phage regulatory protein [Parashewanella spongiae]MCL1078801.1 AlpA family phage regulatory protein [Parashewanella spongiae]
MKQSAIIASMLKKQQPERLIRITEMTVLLGIHRSTLNRRVKRKQFPKPKVGANNRTLGWPVSVYNKWLKQASD